MLAGEAEPLWSLNRLFSTIGPCLHTIASVRTIRHPREIIPRKAALEHSCFQNESAPAELLLANNFNPVSTDCHGRISDGERYVGTVAGRIGYRAINVQESNPVAGSIDKT
jgi:hypothetical protein